MKRSVIMCKDGGKVVTTSDNRGNDVHRADYNEHGQFIGEVIYNHGYHNRCDGWIVYDEHGETIRIFEQTFDGDTHQVTEIIERDGDGNVIDRYSDPLA